MVFNLKSLTDIANIATGSGQPVLTVPVGDVVSKEQVRKRFRNIEELAASMRVEGQQSPIIVSPKNSDGKYVIQKGERRWRAINAAGLPTIDILVRPKPESVIKEVGGELIENMQRDDLMAFEIAGGMSTLLQEGMTRKEIAEYLGKSPSYVSIMLSLPGMPARIKTLYENELVLDPHTLYTLRQIAEIDPAYSVRVCNQIKKQGGISRSKARELLKAIKDSNEDDGSDDDSENTSAANTTIETTLKTAENQPKAVEGGSIGQNAGEEQAPNPAPNALDSHPDNPFAGSQNQPADQGQSGLDEIQQSSSQVTTSAALSGQIPAPRDQLVNPSVRVRVKVAFPDGPAMGELQLDRADESGGFGWVKLDDESGALRVSLGDIIIVELRQVN